MLTEQDNCTDTVKVDRTLEIELTLTELESLHVQKLKVEWDRFLLIPSNTRNELQKRFHIWQPATKRFEVMLWFEKRLLDLLTGGSDKLDFKEKGITNSRICECGQVIAAEMPCYCNRISSAVYCQSCGYRSMMDERIYRGLFAASLLSEVYDELVWQP